MSVASTFASGRASMPAPRTKGILSYLPRPRSPWLPSTFRRGNLLPQDLDKMWGRGRFKNSPSNPMSGYCTKPTAGQTRKNLGSTELIPKHQLEKFMPNIYIGPKALVTPVSLMSARDGHRVTHDLLHSYDPYIGQVENHKPATVDHDNITPLDPNHVGLHGDSISCRSRIYRWLRRAPFFNEDWYFRRTTQTVKNIPIVSEAEAPLCEKIIRLAGAGHIKEACEEYRRLTFIPPIEIYRALTAACIPGALLADAVAIYEDGYRLLYTTRDPDVFDNLLQVAIAANNKNRVMWVYNLARGSFRDNIYARTAVEPIRICQIATTALGYLLDHGYDTEAVTIYRHMEALGMTRFDLYAKAAQQMQQALLQQKEAPAAAGSEATAVMVDVPSQQTLEGLAVYRDALAAAEAVATRVLSSLESHERSFGLLAPTTTAGGGSVAWLLEAFRDIDVLFVLRLARFERGVDMMAREPDRYVERCVEWLDQLSVRSTEHAKPLPYLLKSKEVASGSPNLRVAASPNSDTLKAERLLPTEAGYRFAYSPSTRFVEEYMPALNPDLSDPHNYLARRMKHVASAGVLVDFSGSALQAAAAASSASGGGRPSSLSGAPLRVIHPRLRKDASGGRGGAFAAASPSPAGTTSPSSVPGPDAAVVTDTRTTRSAPAMDLKRFM